MKKEEWNQGLNHLDSGLVEEYVKKKETLAKRRAARALWMRMGVIAACVCVLVSSVLVVPMLSRQMPGGEPEQSTEDSTVEDTSTEDSSEQLIAPPRLPKFNDEELQFFSGELAFPEYIHEKNYTPTTVIDRELYDRCDYTETLLNVKTKWTFSDASSENLFDGPDSILHAEDYDLIICDDGTAVDLMTRGLFSNLLQYKYMDFRHPSWSSSLTENLAVGDKLYFATGSVSLNFLMQASVVFFNKDLVKTLDVREKIQNNWDEQDLYELVASGKWTLDKMITLSQGAYLDQNENKTPDAGDRCGFSTHAAMVDNFYYSGGYTTVVSNGDTWSIHSAFLDADVMDPLLAAVNGLLHTSKDGVLESDALAAQTAFANGNALFALATASDAYEHYRKQESLTYSVLPMPKHRETQTAYAAVPLSGYSVYGICSQSDIPEITSAFLQVFAEESYEIIRPALLDVLMRGRYAEDPEDTEMWEAAIDANVLDAGRVFASYFGETRTDCLTTTLFRAAVEQNTAAWSDAIDPYKASLAQYATYLAGMIAVLPN